MSNLARIIGLRKKLFEGELDRFKKHQATIDSLMIPEHFDVGDCIPRVFSEPNYNVISTFSIEPYSDLLREAQAFADEHSRPMFKGEVEVVVHPFYPIIRHCNLMLEEEGYTCKYEQYERKMLQLLQDHSKQTILFESPESFARFTYQFLVRGNVRQVIFTQHSRSIPLEETPRINPEDVGRISGCYVGHCLKDVIMYAFSEEDLPISSDLVLHRPTGDPK